ncbi:FkbM family methyltransferase [Indibacter alkaliphilus]|nr:FkbM family methyltransferase [Indibacter alkaliphilus]
MEKLAAFFSRHLYVIPGGYFLVQMLRRIFSLGTMSNPMREFSFRSMRLRVDISKSMGAAIYWRGAHDWAPIFVMEKNIQHGSCIIDIGANQGEYSIWAARKAGTNGKVIAFEPMDELFNTLQKNISLNPNYKNVIIPVKVGLSDRPGKLNLYGKEGDNEGVNTLFPTASHNILIQEIELSTLDMELEKMKVDKVDFVKLDVEGAELQVLKGSQKTIEKYRPKWLIEINAEACEAGGYAAEDILQLLSGFGYSFYKIGLRGKLIPLQKIQDEFSNILAVYEA